MALGLPAGWLYFWLFPDIFWRPVAWQIFLALAAAHVWIAGSQSNFSGDGMNDDSDSWLSMSLHSTMVEDFFFQAPSRSSWQETASFTAGSSENFREI